MKTGFIFLSAVVIFCLLAGSNCLAVSVSGIDRVRGKDVLDDADLKVIDSFLSQAVSEIQNTTDFTSVSKTLAIVISRKNTDKVSSQGQYQAQFSDSANKYIPAALKNIDKMSADERTFKVKLNLLILINNLEDARLAKTAADYLADENAAIRYWAVQNLTNEGIIAKINADIRANGALAKRVVKEFDKLFASAEPAMLVNISRFAAKVAVIEGRELLVKIANYRIKAYEKGQIGNALVDSDILKLLGYKIQTADSQEEKTQLGRLFGQQLSYVMQKYMAGKGLSADEKQQLGSVLVEIEKSCLGDLLGADQYKIRLALSDSSYGSLLQEHDRLLGSDDSEGQLGKTLGFNYGKDKQGKDRLGPAKLPI